MRFILFGPRSIGKTTVGKILAKKLKINYLDLDEFVEGKLGNIKKYSEKFGVESYRIAESEMLKEFCSNLPQECVFSIGGGTVASQFERLNKKNTSILKHCGELIYLAPPGGEEKAAKIIFSREKKRFGDKDYLETLKLLKLRKLSYEKIFDVKIEVHDKSPGKIAKEVLAKIRKP